MWIILVLHNLVACQLSVVILGTQYKQKLAVARLVLLTYYELVDNNDSMRQSETSRSINFSSGNWQHTVRTYRHDDMVIGFVRSFLSSLEIFFEKGKLDLVWKTDWSAAWWPLGVLEEAKMALKGLYKIDGIEATLIAGHCTERGSHRKQYNPALNSWIGQWFSYHDNHHHCAFWCTCVGL